MSNSKELAQLLKQIEQSELSILVLLQIDDFEVYKRLDNPELIQSIEKNFISEIASFFPTEYKFEYIYSLGSLRFAFLGDFDGFAKTNLNIQEYLKLFIKKVKNSDLNLDITISYSLGNYMLYEDSLEGLKEAIGEKQKIRFSNDDSTINIKKIKEKEFLQRLIDENRYSLKPYYFFSISKTGAVKKVTNFPILDFFKFVFKS